MAGKSYQFKCGDRVAVKIGNRPTLHLAVVSRELRPAPYYRLNWAAAGFSKLLNTVALPETSLSRSVFAAAE